MKDYPAIDVQCESVDAMLALVDDFAPTAIEEHGQTTRVFFSTPDVRDRAGAALADARCTVASIDVNDEDWARRSQEGLLPVTVGQLTIAPSPQPLASSLHSPAVLVIQPSMGFGTGHHATTRLCLAALQRVEISGRTMLDVGTGSGVLAIAAARLGARQSLGIDNDPDAVQAARENLALNPEVGGVEFRVAELGPDLPPSDVVTANLTGALLVRTAPTLLSLVRPGGVLIVSGLLAEERPDVQEAFSSVQLAWAQQEDEWVGLMLQR